MLPTGHSIWSFLEQRGSVLVAKELQHLSGPRSPCSQGLENLMCHIFQTPTAPCSLLVARPWWYYWRIISILHDVCVSVYYMCTSVGSCTATLDLCLKKDPSIWQTMHSSSYLPVQVVLKEELLNTPRSATCTLYKMCSCRPLPPQLHPWLDTALPINQSIAPQPSKMLLSLKIDQERKLFVKIRILMSSLRILVADLTVDSCWWLVSQLLTLYSYTGCWLDRSLVNACTLHAHMPRPLASWAESIHLCRHSYIGAMGWLARLDSTRPCNAM